MKTIIITVAALTVFKAATAYLSHYDHQDLHEQLAHQPGEYQQLVKNLAASNDYVDVLVDSPALPSSHVAAHPDQDTHNKDLTSSSSIPVDGPSHKYKYTVGTTGSQWAIVYHPYNSDGTCRTRSVVHANMATIQAKGFVSIRLHNHDCNILPKLSSSTQVSTGAIRLILGIHIDETGLDAALPHIEDIIEWATHPTITNDPHTPSHQQQTDHQKTHWPTVELIVIGEETLFNTHVPHPRDLATFIHNTRAQFRSAGYTGPLTTTEPLHILHEARQYLCPELDVIASNIHPFFNPAVTAEGAGGYVKEALAVLEEDICPLSLLSPASSSSEGGGGRDGERLQAINLETGWPRGGRANGEAVPGVREQEVAVKSIMEGDGNDNERARGSGGRSVVLGFGDDEWMEEGEFGVEGLWGCDRLWKEKEREAKSGR